MSDAAGEGRGRTCALIPTYDNPLTVRRAVEAMRAHGLDVVLVDDGSGPENRAACEAIAREGLAHLCRRDRNGGKGAAVWTGLERARELGYDHAFQIDADLQHDLARVPAFLAASAAQPAALVLGYPEYDRSAPAGRLIGRRITTFWVGLEVGRRARVVDAMIGFRVYPIAAALGARPRSRRMGFDVEIIVRMARGGTPIVNLPVGVRYPEPGEGGVSHFRPVRDNLAFCLLHARLCTAGVLGWCWRAVAGRAFAGEPRT